MKTQVSTLARVEGLTIWFEDRTKPVVDSVSFEVCPGECVALVGESGSGKSLTAKALLGLLPQSAGVAGSLTLEGGEAPEPTAVAWNAIRGVQVSLVPQDALGSLDPLRRIELEVGDTLRLHALARGKERKERVITALEEAGMPAAKDQLRKRSDELSGGLRQRALVASALIAAPRLIVADEPTTALDAVHRSHVLTELRRRVDAGAGAVLISHDLASVRSVAHRVLVMRDGQVIEQGTVGEVFDSPKHPFTQQLIAASPVGRVRPSSKNNRAASIVASTPRLELRSISAHYLVDTERRQVVHDASFEVHANETVGLVGESGSGKTTLLRVALGLHRPSHGQVLIDGVDRSSANRSVRQQLRRRVGLVPQDPLDTFAPGALAGAILMDALRAARVARSERKHQSTQLASEVGLAPELLARPAATLSGGQRQRLAIARALAGSPELLLLDEPVSALDLTVQARVLELLNAVQKQRGTAYLLVSHDEDVITYMSDRVLRLEAGMVCDE